MDINGMRYRISRLRQERGGLEHSCEQVGEMLKGSYIRRYLPRGEKAFKSVKDTDIKGVLPGAGKLYGYITYLKDGVTRHKYVRRENEAEAMKLCERYQEWNNKMARIREINQVIVKLLDEIGKKKTEEVKKNVKERKAKKNPKRNGGKEKTK